MLRNVERLSIITVERIHDEFMKMLSAAYPLMAMDLLRKSGAVHYVIPELEKTYDMTQNSYHFGTVWEHTMQVLENISAVTDRSDLRLAALLHDIGKIQTREEGNDGNVHFILHDIKGAKMVRNIMTRLKYSNRIIDEVVFLTRYHMICKFWGEMRQNKLDRKIRKLQYVCKSEQLFNDLLTLIHADNMDYDAWDSYLYELQWTDYVNRQRMNSRLLSTSPYPWSTDSTTFVNDALTETSVPAPKMNEPNEAEEELLDKPITNITMSEDGLISFVFLGAEPIVDGLGKQPLWDNDEPAVFDLRGRRVNQTGRGVYIVRNQNGTIRKVFK
jgi:putative nucleotidyltransferase with HDIG domain